MRTVTSELSKEIRIDRTKAYRTSDKPLCQKLMTLFLITSFSECKISLKLDILSILLVAILVVMLSTGVVEALLSVQGNTLDNPTLIPISSTVANISNDPLKVGKATVFTFLDGDIIDKFRMKPKVLLAPGEDFLFSPELGQLNGTPLVTLFGKKTSGIVDPDDPYKLAVLFMPPDPGESPKLQVDFLSAVTCDPDGTTLGVIFENTGLEPWRIVKIVLPKIDQDLSTDGNQQLILKPKKTLAPGESFKMIFNLKDVDSNPIVLDDGQKKVRIKPVFKTDDGFKFKIYQSVKVNCG